LHQHLIHKTAHSTQSAAQVPAILFRDRKCFTPQEIFYNLSKKYQLTCHFIYQSPLIEANLCERAQPPDGIQYPALVRSPVNQARKLSEHVGQVVYKLLV
jgi:hypothetical protein